MRLKYFFLLTLLILLFPGTGQTQNKVVAIDSIFIDLWPDYDQASVLILLTGTLPADTILPTSVTLPYPENAQLNAIARIDSLDGKMKDDIVSTPAPGTFTFITPDLRFRLEYYIPYEVNNDQRSFNFTWLADLSVNRMLLRVQQPIFATTFTTEPEILNTSDGEGGMTYYTLPTQAVPAGQSLSMRVNYTMTTPQLSVASLPLSRTDVKKPALPATSNTETCINWPIAAIGAGIFILTIVIVWQIASRRAMAGQTTTGPVNANQQSTLRFCSNCGNSIGKGDKFCMKCGAPLK